MLDNPDYPCLELPTNICIEKKVYSGEVMFPLRDESYFIAYQGCCRTGSLVNILSPLGVGSTYHIELLPEAQIVCNSSPEFQAIPPTVICIDEPINYSQQAIDLEGDQLVYELCAPLNFDNPINNNPIPPPYFSVPFIAPDYAAAYPLGNGVLSIDPNTGLLSGMPNITGQFVVGICVNEYRNGTLLSTTRRDIQFNVAPCPPLVFAEIEADEISGQDTYIINACREQDISLINNSTQTEYIDSLLWSIDMNGNTMTSSDWEPSFFFEEGGSHEGSLILNPGGFCTDTANFVINVVTEIQADFTAEYDTCVGGPVTFYNNSFSVGSDIEDWFWTFGDSATTSLKNPTKIFEAPGFHEVFLTITDEFNCKDTVVKTVQWQPAPEVIIVSPDFSAGCVPLSVNFNNLSWPIDSTYEIFWDFGDGDGMSNAMSPAYTYSKTGSYSPFVSVVSPIGCYVDTFFSDLILVEPKPAAAFSYTPDLVTNIQSDVVFVDNSERAVSWKWIFDDTDSFFVSNPMYTFSDTGLHEVKLTIEDIYGCTDTLSKKIDVVPHVTFYLPNAFTPNGDGRNDVFKGKGMLDGLSGFRLKIWNRWGEMVFETVDPNQGWNGRLQNIGRTLPAGVYSYTLFFEEIRGQRHKREGVVVLIN